MSDLGDKARDEFLSEAQEIIDRLSRDLLLLDATSRVGPADPDLVNGVFRGVHTLKGLCGLFNATRLATLSHELENLLDGLRLGRHELTADVLDLLFRAVEIYNRLLAANRDARPEDSEEELEVFLRELRKLSAPPSSAVSRAIPYELDPSMLAVLTEYEEHRLRTSIEHGLRLHRIRAAFKLATIDDQLESMKLMLKPFGEILTYLPTGGGADADSIELEILMASGESTPVLTEALASIAATVEELPRVAPSNGPPAKVAKGTLPPPAPPVSMIEPPRSVALPSRLSLSPAIVHEKNAKQSVTAKPLREASLRSVAQTVRVDIQRLDHLMNLVGELSIVRGALARVVDRTRGDAGHRELARELGRLHHGFSRHLAAMQTAILEVRMVPLGQVFEKLARVARQASREVRREVNLVITGAETEVDKLIGEELSDPLMHMIRNALDHGIEDAARRELVGKPVAGTIALNAYQKGNQVVVEIEDDGGGIDDQRLVKVAVAAKVLTQEEADDLSPRERLALIFLPGITTRAGADQISGRGVGMDVVKTNIGRLGGVVDVHSEIGIGSKFTITLPITLAMISALMVSVRGHTYAVPLSSVQEAVMVDAAKVRVVEGRELVTMRGESLPLCRLRDVFGTGGPEPVGPASRRLLVVVASAASRRCGFVVDDILGRQDIVIKPLTGPLRSAPGFAGATELGDQRVALVIDVPSLLEEALSAGVLTKASAGASHG